MKAVALPPCQPQLLALFDRLIDVIFSMKDDQGVYLAVNNAFVKRTGQTSKRDVIGGRASDFFPAPLAERYAEQDARVLATGRTLRDEIELIRSEDGGLGWYVTTKSSLDALPDGSRPGLVTISQDLKSPAEGDQDAHALAPVVDFVKLNLQDKISVAALAEVAGMSGAQLDRRMRKAFGLSPSKYLARARVSRASDLLSDPSMSLADVAVASGFYDQANLTHQFARLTGETPAQFRATQLARLS